MLLKNFIIEFLASQPMNYLWIHVLEGKKFEKKNLRSILISNNGQNNNNNNNHWVLAFSIRQ